jgi:hypothetical protein
MKLIAAFVALSLCATWFLFTRAAADGNSKNSLSPFTFVADSHIHGHYDQLITVWKGRIASNWITGRLSDAVAQNGILPDAPFQNVFGLYNATWLLLIFALVIFLGDNPILVIPFIFAGLCYLLTPPDEIVIFPWDMPSMFFWTCSFLVWQRKHYFWTLAIIVVGTAFKETVAVTAFLFFFTTLERRKQWAFFGAAFVGCLLLRLGITFAVLGEPHIFTADTSDVSLRLIGDFFTPQVNHFIWVNGGTFMIALFLPMKTLADKGTKCVLLVFLAGMTATVIMAGPHYEFRQFLDVLPISVFYLDRTIQHWKTMEDSRERM